MSMEEDIEILRSIDTGDDIELQLNGILQS